MFCIYIYIYVHIIKPRSSQEKCNSSNKRVESPGIQALLKMVHKYINQWITIRVPCVNMFTFAWAVFKIPLSFQYTCWCGLGISHSWIFRIPNDYWLEYNPLWSTKRGLAASAHSERPKLVNKPHELCIYHISPISTIVIHSSWSYLSTN